MMEFLLGMAGCAIMLAAFGLGWCVGRGARSEGGGGSCHGIPCRSGRHAPPRGPVRPDRQETPCHPPLAGDEADEMRAAFEAVMNYNTETAYGLNRGIGGDET